MMFDDKPLAEIAEPDLLALREDAVPEGKTLDYKLEVGNRREARKEFLKDCSSFANTAGGHLLIGVKEGPPGLPAEFPGVPNALIDEQRARFENMLRDAVSPRIQGAEMVAVPIGDGTASVHVLRFQSSVAKPHVVDFDGHWRFYARNSAGAYPLDVDQLREAFLLGDRQAERIRAFRTSRLASLLSDELPMRLRSVDVFLVQLVPASAFDPGRRLPTIQLDPSKRSQFGPIGRGGGLMRTNLDGLLLHSEPNREDGSLRSYLQVFASGIIETAAADPLNNEHGVLTLYAGTLEHWLWYAIPEYIDYMANQLGVDFPIVMMISLLGARGALFKTRDPWADEEHHLIDRDNLLFPEVLVDRADQPRSQYLTPVFEALWNAGGYSVCRALDEEGNLR